MTKPFLIEALTQANVLIVGAGQGIGSGFVDRLLQEASVAQIFATYRTAINAQKLLNLAEVNRDRVIPIQMDITDESAVMQMVEQLTAQTSSLHLVINCVGFLHDGQIQPEKSLKQINPDSLFRYFQVNSIGAILLAKHLQPLLKHRDRSIFAHLSAKVGSIGDNKLGGWYGYRASKAALNMLMRNVAIEYKRTNPKAIVAVLHPGTTDTQLSKPFQRTVQPEKLFSTQRTVDQLLTVIQGLNEQDSGEFWNWDGSQLPW